MGRETKAAPAAVVVAVSRPKVVLRQEMPYRFLTESWILDEEVVVVVVDPVQATPE